MKPLLEEPPLLLFGCPEKQAQPRRWDHRGWRVYPGAGSGGEGCLVGTLWRWTVPQRGERCQADCHRGVCCPYHFSGQSKLVLSTRCRAGTRVRQARHPGDRTHGGLPLWGPPCPCTSLGSGAACNFAPREPCLPHCSPASDLLCAPSALGRGVSSPSLPQRSPRGTVLFSHSSPYPFLWPVLFFLTSVLFQGNFTS